MGGTGVTVGFGRGVVALGWRLGLGEDRWRWGGGNLSFANTAITKRRVKYKARREDLRAAARNGSWVAPAQAVVRLRELNELDIQLYEWAAARTKAQTEASWLRRSATVPLPPLPTLPCRDMAACLLPPAAVTYALPERRKRSKVRPAELSRISTS